MIAPRVMEHHRAAEAVGGRRGDVECFDALPSFAPRPFRLFRIPHEPEAHRQIVAASERQRKLEGCEQFAFPFGVIECECFLRVLARLGKFANEISRISQ